MDIKDIKDIKETNEVEILNKYIDACIFNSTHYDIAFVVHKYLKDKHRYVKNNTWEYLADTEWLPDIKNENLTYSIRTIVCSAFTQRSLYWADANNIDVSKYQDTEFISNKLLLISLKLKENKYISVLIKECKQFFI
jgi:hypothetical protein